MTDQGPLAPAAVPYPLPPPPPVAPGGAPIAEASDRFLAHLIDAVILAVVNLIPMLVVFGLFTSRVFDLLHRMVEANNAAAARGEVADSGGYLTQIFTLELVMLAVLLPILFVISYLYVVEYSARKGQTIGKRVMKLKIVNVADGSPATKQALCKRWLVMQPASLIAPYFIYADLLWLAWDKPYRQCLHDKCAATVVVKLTA